jgi:hypothetical protein
MCPSCGWGRMKMDARLFFSVSGTRSMFLSKIPDVAQAA